MNGIEPEGESCGCFEPPARAQSPSEAFWQDLLLLLPPLLLAWLATSRGLAGKRLAIATLLTAGLTVFAWKSPELPLDDYVTQLKPAALPHELCVGNAELGSRTCLDGILPELAHGTHLVILADLSEDAFSSEVPTVSTSSNGSKVCQPCGFSRARPKRNCSSSASAAAPRSRSARHRLPCFRRFTAACRGPFWSKMARSSQPSTACLSRPMAHQGAMRSDMNRFFDMNTYSKSSLPAAIALLALLATTLPATAQGVPADAVFQGFKPTGEFTFSLAGKDLKDAEIYLSERAGAYLVIARRSPRRCSSTPAPRWSKVSAS